MNTLTKKLIKTLSTNTLLFSVVMLSSQISGCSNDYIDQRERSPHFIDGQFKNKHHQESDWWDFLKMRWNTTSSEWPEWITTDYANPPQQPNQNNALTITVINHATVLIQGDGHNILTDPVFSNRVSPVSFAGPARVRNPGIRFKDLPSIDAIIISHDHYDHLDLATLKRLIKRDNPKVYLGLGVGKNLDSMQNIVEMDWWETAKVSDNFNIHFVPVQHFSGRGLFDRFSTLWGGFVLELAGKKIYFGGDSGYADHYQQTFDKFGAMDVALIPIGAYAPRWFMGFVHMDPKQAVQAHLDLQAKKSIGIHYGTFQLTAEPINEPETLLAKERQAAGVADDAFITLDFGRSLSL